MIRRFFVDCVIVCAMCAVVWGVMPVLIADDNTSRPSLSPPLYHKDDLPGEAIFSGSTCCYLFGNSNPCIKDEDGMTGLCKIYPSCNSVYQWYGCKCGSWAKKQSGYGSDVYLVQCRCGG